MNGFIKDNNTLLEQDRFVDDQLDNSHNLKDLNELIKNTDDLSVIGIIGPFGSGKSYLIDQYLKENTDKYNPIYFDAWKYPDKRELWEGFILEIAKADGLSIKKIDNIIEGTYHHPIYKVIVGISIVFAGISILYKVDLFKISMDNIIGFNWVVLFLTKYYLLAFIILLILLIGYILNECFKNKILFYQNPAKRVDHYQNILSRILTKSKEPNKKRIFILEDLDRASEWGIYFLETLKLFINQNRIKLDNSLFIVPISKVNFNKNRELYYKSLDIIENFIPKYADTKKRYLPVPSMYKFIKCNIKKSFLNKDNNKSRLASFLETLWGNYPNDINMRTLKAIIRNANKKYVIMNNRLEVDFELCILFESMKFIYSEDPIISIFDKIKNNNNLLNLQENIDTLRPFRNYFYSIVEKRKKLIDIKPGSTIRIYPDNEFFKERFKGRSIKTIYQEGQKSNFTYFIKDYYIKY